jgi:hypothetical protein
MGKILVKQAVEAQYPVGAGAPIFVLGGGGRGGRARTLRESAAGLAGGLAGALGAFTGQHRSLGGLAQSAISGGAQGAALGRSLGRIFVSPEDQARANLRSEMAEKYAAARASGEFDRYGVQAEGRTPRTRIGVMLSGQGKDSMMGRRLSELERAKQAEKDMLAEQKAEAQARAKARGTQAGEEDKRYSKIGRVVHRRAADGMDLDDFESRVNEFDAAYNQGQGQPRAQGQQGGVDAANNPVQVIGPATPMNALPAPATVPTVGQEIAEEEKPPTGDTIDHDGEYQTFGLETQGQEKGGMSEEQERSLNQKEKLLNAMAMAGRQNYVQGEEKEPQFKRLDDFGMTLE